MALIKFFNAFVLKKNINNTTSTPASEAAYKPVFPGLQKNPAGYPLFPTSANSPLGRTKPISSDSDNVRNWIIEEARITGGYNNANAGYGVRAYLVEDTNDQSKRLNALIYSGVYNSNTNFNQTNVFSVGEQITKAVEPTYGSIQKLHALDSNLAIFQENKVSRALIDKDAIYSAEGDATLTSRNIVIGQISPYVGEYGISKNPETFAYFGYRRYFVDKYRNTVMRLSRDGMTPISSYGMVDFFRDELSQIEDQFQEFTFTCVLSSSASDPSKIVLDAGPNVSSIEKGMQVSIPQTGAGNDIIISNVLGIFNGVNIFIDTDPGSPIAGNITFTKFIKDKIVGGYDVHNNNYVVSLQQKSTSPSESDTFKTLAFEDSINGWVSFYSYKPNFMSSLKNNYYSFFGSDIYQHYDELTPNNSGVFYGSRSGSSVTFIFNPIPSVTKNFNTVSYEGSNGWQIDSYKSDFQGFDLVNGQYIENQDVTSSVKSYDEGLYTSNGVPQRAGFNRKENRYVANLISNSSARAGEVIFGNSMSGIKGYFTTVKISTDNTTQLGGAKELFSVSSNYVISSY
tara:strand:- start:3917 stop:5623 length:1707 start_codon:yes stop_codon:yes gene_type:complete